MIVRFLHHPTSSIDHMVKLEIELYDKKFNDRQFGFTEKWDKVILYDIDLLKNKKFLNVFQKYGVTLL